MNGVRIMEDKAILKEAMRERNERQTALAGKIGIKQSSLSTALRRDRMSMDVFAEILDAMEYDVVVVDRRTGEPMWQVGTDDI